MSQHPGRGLVLSLYLSERYSNPPLALARPSRRGLLMELIGRYPELIDFA